MNSLDRAFIRAYARDPKVDSLNATAQSPNSTQGTPRQVSSSRQQPTLPGATQFDTASADMATATAAPRRAASQPAPTRGSDPLVQVSYADGSWYRIEQQASAPGNISPPHMPCETKQVDPPAASSQQGPDDDVDLMARFRPPLFRNVDLRSHEHAVSVKAQAQAIAAPASEHGPATMPSLDYTLAPPSPPVAPKVPLSDMDSGEAPTRAAKIKVAVSPFAELAREQPAATEESAARLSAEEIQDYAAQCQHLQSVVLELSSVENLGSPEEAHVMLVDVPLEMIESESERIQKQRTAEQQARQREAMLAALMQQELIVGDACDPQWLYGSESQAKAEPRQPRETEVPEPISLFTPAGRLAKDHQAVLLRSIVNQIAEICGSAATGTVNMATRLVALESHESEEPMLLQFSHDFVAEIAAEEPVESETQTQQATATKVTEPAAQQLAEEMPAEEPDSEPQPPAAFSPAWEVDRIVWPVMTDQLLGDIAGQLQSAIATFQRSPAARMVAVSGHERGEGRTTLAICLARSAAEAGLRVALVDADFTSPALAECLSLDTMNGWDGVLQSGTALNEAAIASIDDRLTIVPLEKPLTPQTVRENSGPLGRALEQLAESYDLLLLDAGPVGELLVEGSWLSQLAAKPGLLLAHDMREASVLEVQQTIELSQAMGVEVVGVAQTFAPKEAA